MSDTKLPVIPIAIGAVCVILWVVAFILGVSPLILAGIGVVFLALVGGFYFLEQKKAAEAPAAADPSQPPTAIFGPGSATAVDPMDSMSPEEKKAAKAAAKLEKRRLAQAEKFRKKAEKEAAKAAKAAAKHGGIATADQETLAWLQQVRDTNSNGEGDFAYDLAAAAEEEARLAQEQLANQEVFVDETISLEEAPAEEADPMFAAVPRDYLTPEVEAPAQVIAEVHIPHRPVAAPMPAPLAPAAPANPWDVAAPVAAAPQPTPTTPHPAPTAVESSPEAPLAEAPAVPDLQEPDTEEPIPQAPESEVDASVWGVPAPSPTSNATDDEPQDSPPEPLDNVMATAQAEETSQEADTSVSDQEVDPITPDTDIWGVPNVVEDAPEATEEAQASLTEPSVSGETDEASDNAPEEVETPNETVAEIEQPPTGEAFGETVVDSRETAMTVDPEEQEAAVLAELVSQLSSDQDFLNDTADSPMSTDVDTTNGEGNTESSEVAPLSAADVFLPPVPPSRNQKNKDNSVMSLSTSEPVDAIEHHEEPLRGELERVEPTSSEPVLVSDPSVAAVANQISRLIADAEWRVEQRYMKQIEAVKQEADEQVRLVEQQAAERITLLEETSEAERKQAEAEAEARVSEAVARLDSLRAHTDRERESLMRQHAEELAGKADPEELAAIERQNSQLSDALEDAEKNLEQVLEANRTVAEAAATSARLHQVSSLRKLRSELATSGADFAALEKVDNLINDLRR